MFTPFLRSRIEKRVDGTGLRIDAGFECPLVAVAAWTSKGEVLKFGFTTGISRPDMINRKPGDLALGGDPAILTTASCPCDHT